MKRPKQPKQHSAGAASQAFTEPCLLLQAWRQSLWLASFSYKKMMTPRCQLEIFLVFLFLFCTFFDCMWLLWRWCYRDLNNWWHIAVYWVHLNAYEKDDFSMLLLLLLLALLLLPANAVMPRIAAWTLCSTRSLTKVQKIKNNKNLLNFLCIHIFILWMHTAHCTAFIYATACRCA